MDKRILDVSPDKGITRTWHFNPDTEETTIQTSQDVTEVIEANKMNPGENIFEKSLTQAPKFGVTPAQLTGFFKRKGIGFGTNPKTV